MRSAHEFGIVGRGHAPAGVGTTCFVQSCSFSPSAAYAVGGGMPPPYNRLSYPFYLFTVPYSRFTIPKNRLQRRAQWSCPTNRLSHPRRRARTRKGYAASVRLLRRQRLRRRPRRAGAGTTGFVQTRSFSPSSASRSDGACPIPTAVDRTRSAGADSIRPCAETAKSV